MSFGLKNADATFQRCMQKCLLPQLGRNIHVYVDDIMVTTKQHVMLLDDLKETFANLHEYQIKLNPEKCVFGMPAGKLLGFLVSEHGIDANPEKINQLGERALPLYQPMKKSTLFEWNDQADEAFRDLKRILSTAPVLAAPTEKEPLLLYIAATSQSVSMMVVERPEKGKIQSVRRPVYYLSEVLSASKQNYPHYQKMCYDVYFTAKKLKQYFEEHVVTVVSTAPIGEIIGCRDAFDRYLPPPPDSTHWRMDFDGSKIHSGLGAGIVLSSPKGDRLQYMLQIHFAASNKCSGEWDTRDANMASYRFLVQQLSVFFDSCEFLHVPCVESEAADALAKIGSSRQAIQSGVSLEHLHKPSVKPSPESESIFIPDDPATSLPRLGTVDPGSGAAESNPGTAELGPGAAVLDSAAVIPNPEGAASGSGAATTEPAMVAVFAVVTAPSWALPISEFLENRVLPMDETEARQVQRQAFAYSIINNELVKRSSKTGVFQCYVEQDKGIEILLDIHQGECGNHAASRSLVAKAFRHGFYWPTILPDAESLILRCEGFQCFSKRSH
ncbi:uncharacterized protein [Aegilops tauschii subsp. strangulata]|uniref:uncharacterized protein n=1 Tax=Aegilops tauschii subsp. strangulata TaxID=200361 RepID=UPI00098BA4E4|nr:uncharacterized protein LOC109744038 [Aegilops tauschii subsp. strangulata]